MCSSDLHHVAYLYNRHKIHNIWGVDQSKAMLAEAQLTYPTIPKDRWICKDVIKDDISFPYQSLTHVLCLYFTFAQFKNVTQLTQLWTNVYMWLKPNGWFVIHTANPTKFDPLLSLPEESSSVFNKLSISPQKYTKDGQRITTNRAVFDQFYYKSNFRMDQDTNKIGRAHV